MKVTKEMRDGEHLIRFEVPILGSYSVGWDPFKYLEPFAHYTKEEKEAYRKERSKRPKYTVWHNGGGIGAVDDLEEGRKVIKKHAGEMLRYYLDKTESTLGELVQLKKVMKKGDWLADYSKH